MRGWVAAVAVAGVLGAGAAGAAEVAVPVPVPVPVDHAGSSAEVEALKAKLAEAEARLNAVDDAQHFSEAERLGVAQAVRQSGLTPRQQRRLAAAIVREAERNGLDPLLVVALIRCESSFNNYAVSHVGAMGLMQVMPDTGNFLAERSGTELGKTTNLFDAELNVELGTAYLAELIQRFGTVEKALVAYNAGPGLAQKILAKKDVRRKFMAGYPAKVVKEFRRLKALQQRDLTLRAERETDGSQG